MRPMFQPTREERIAELKKFTQKATLHPAEKKSLELLISYYEAGGDLPYDHELYIANGTISRSRPDNLAPDDTLFVEHLPPLCLFANLG